MTTDLYNQLYCLAPDGHGIETFSLGVQNSCSLVFTEVAQRVGAKKYYNYFKAFGFAAKTDIDITSESASLYASWNDFNDIITLSNYSVGQDFRITPIQLITAVSVIANGGYLLKPYLVREFADSYNNIVKTIEPKVIRKVISDETSRQVCEILKN